MGEVESFCKHAFYGSKICTYCGRRLSLFGGRFDSKTKDYVVPLSKGGQDVAENIVASCRECHILKRDYLNYALLPLFLNRPRLLADIRRYLREVRQVVRNHRSVLDFPR